MKKPCRRLLILLSALLLAVLAPATTAAALEPPCFLILTDPPPAAAEMSLHFPESIGQEPIPLEKDSRAWESYFRFHFQGVPMSWRDGMPEGTELWVEMGDDHFSCPIPEKRQPDYNTVFVLDWEERTLREGVPENRAGLLLAIRVGLSAAVLLCQAGIFWLLGFRTKRSWLVFLVSAIGISLLINLGLVTGGCTLYDSYTGWAVTAVLLAEFFICILEPVAFSLLIWEKGSGRSAVGALVPNGFALAVTVLAICLLPM